MVASVLTTPGDRFRREAVRTATLKLHRPASRGPADRGHLPWDVGRYVLEEVDAISLRRSGGANFGWNRLEGRRRHNGGPPPQVVPPTHQHDHSDGRCAVIGGFVYRGTQLRGLQGAYVYGDVCDGCIRVLARGPAPPRPGAAAARAWWRLLSEGRRLTPVDAQTAGVSRLG
jgi:hypothetical protein